MRKALPSPLGLIALHLENDRRLLVCQQGMLIQQRYGASGWEKDEEPWDDIGPAMETAAKYICAARMQLKVPKIYVRNQS